MVHGQPDFGMYARKSTTYGLADMGELAVRLGSVVSYDRRGDVVWIETFENGITNWLVGGAAGYTVAESALESLSHGVSVKLDSPNAGAFDSHISRHSALPVNSKIGFEFAFLPNTHVDDVRIGLVIYDGTQRYMTYIMVRVDAGEIDYYNEARAFVNFASGLTIRQDARTWHYAKLVVDYESNDYVRFLLDNAEYSMAGLKFDVAADALGPMLYTQVLQYYAGGVNTPTLYVDNIILTQNEP